MKVGLLVWIFICLKSTTAQKWIIDDNEGFESRVPPTYDENIGDKLYSGSKPEAYFLHFKPHPSDSYRKQPTKFLLLLRLPQDEKAEAAQKIAQVMEYSQAPFSGAQQQKADEAGFDDEPQQRIKSVQQTKQEEAPVEQQRASPWDANKSYGSSPSSGPSDSAKSYGSSAPSSYGSSAPSSYGSAAPSSYGSAAPSSYGSAAPSSYGSAAPPSFGSAPLSSGVGDSAKSYGSSAPSSALSDSIKPYGSAAPSSAPIDGVKSYGSSAQSSAPLNENILKAISRQQSSSDSCLICLQKLKMCKAGTITF